MSRHRTRIVAVVVVAVLIVSVIAGVVAMASGSPESVAENVKSGDFVPQIISKAEAPGVTLYGVKWGYNVRLLAVSDAGYVDWLE